MTSEQMRGSFITVTRAVVWVPYLPLLYLCSNVFASLGRDEEWARWFVQESICLTVNVQSHGDIAQFLQIEL